MAKKVVKKAVAVDSLELRRWCIEQATRWPTEVPNGAYGIASGGGGYRQEADLIGRAKRLLDWVTAN